MHVRFVRAPHASGYNLLDVREDAIITYALGYLDAIGHRAVDVRDFHLDRDLRFEHLVDDEVDAYVVALRETGANVHYVRRIVAALSRRTERPILVYGQVGRLAAFDDWPSRVLRVEHHEPSLAAALGLPADGPTFTGGLRAKSYFDSIGLSDARVRRRRASLETSRGCHYRCGFCFINHGVNYPERWQLRPVKAIIDDLRAYRELGIRDVLFHDSELIGARPEDEDRLRMLFTLIRDELPGTRFMLYARADTLLRFDAFDLLREAGLVCVFIGVESLANEELKKLRKGLDADATLGCIDELRDRGIYLHLNFMLFNRGTTIATLRQNVASLRKLASRDPRPLGIPQFLFSFESPWDEQALHHLSNKSYIRWMVWKRAQAREGVVFDPRLEPVVEICRLVFYELACKLTELNLARDEARDGELEGIEAWFAELWPFSTEIVSDALDRFEAGRLKMDALSGPVDEAFARLRALNACLPERLRELHTLEHARRIGAGDADVPVEDHGWDHIIPGGVDDPNGELMRCRAT